MPSRRRRALGRSDGHRCREEPPCVSERAESLEGLVLLRASRGLFGPDLIEEESPCRAGGGVGAASQVLPDLPSLPPATC